MDENNIRRALAPRFSYSIIRDENTEDSRMYFKVIWHSM